MGGAINDNSLANPPLFPPFGFVVLEAPAPAALSAKNWDAGTGAKGSRLRLPVDAVMVAWYLPVVVERAVVFSA